jgi:hypothetical protein
VREDPAQPIIPEDSQGEKITDHDGDGFSVVEQQVARSILGQNSCSGQADQGFPA